MKITKKDLHEWWSTGNHIRYQGKMYQVHKMSYGDYFLEKSDWQGGEKDGFAPDTLWFYKVPKEDVYKIIIK